MSHLRGELSEGRAHMDYIQTLRAHVLLFALVLVSLGICYVVQSLAS